MQQLGQISSQVLGIPFYKIRSLFEEAGEFVVRESLSPALVSGPQDSLDLLGGHLMLKRTTIEPRFWHFVVMQRNWV